MKRVFVGIDIGSSGAVTILDEEDNPQIKRLSSSIENSFKILKQIKEEYAIALCVMEKCSPRPRWGSRNFKFGGNYYSIQAFLMAMDIKYKMVNPKEWQGKLLSESDDSTKDRSLLGAKTLYPKVKIGKNHNIADSIHLARYAEYLYLSEENSE